MFKNICKESITVDNNQGDQWIKNRPALSHNFSSDNVFNTDEANSSSVLLTKSLHSKISLVMMVRQRMDHCTRVYKYVWKFCKLKLGLQVERLTPFLYIWRTATEERLVTEAEGVMFDSSSRNRQTQQNGFQLIVPTDYLRIFQKPYFVFSVGKS